MKKKDIIDLIRAHVDNNNMAFRETSYEIAREFDASGDYQLSEFIFALLSDSNAFVPQMVDSDCNYIEKVSATKTSLHLP